jgi:Asp-tRNA(Asn)/Glu-tRNA(Gln) amidotransferase A subunit family amidase
MDAGAQIVRYRVPLKYALWQEREYPKTITKSSVVGNGQSFKHTRATARLCHQGRAREKQDRIHLLDKHEPNHASNRSVALGRPPLNIKQKGIPMCYCHDMKQHDEDVQEKVEEAVSALKSQLEELEEIVNGLSADEARSVRGYHALIALTAYRQKYGKEEK